MARIASYIFHPLLMPTYLFLLLSQTFPVALDPIQPSSHLLFITLIFIITFLFPVLNLGILKTLGVINSYHMPTRSERVLPFSIVALLYAGVTVLFYYQTRVSLSDNFMKLMVVIDLLALAAALITFFYRISIHSLTAWGIVIILILLNRISELNSLFYPGLAAIVLTGFIMSARIADRAHTLKEVLWGGVAGAITGAIGMFLLFLKQ